MFKQHSFFLDKNQALQFLKYFMKIVAFYSEK